MYPQSVQLIIFSDITHISNTKAVEMSYDLAAMINNPKDNFMEPMGISINQLLRDLTVPPNRISEIVNGRRAIAADTALRLQRYFGVETQFWLNLQSEYDLRKMKRKIWYDIEQRIIPVQDLESKYQGLFETDNTTRDL